MNSVRTRFARFSLALTLALGMVSMPSASEAAPPTCPRVVFLGLHGLNEGAAGGAPDKNYWGTMVDSTWQNFKAHYNNGKPKPAELQAKSVSYPKLKVLLTEPLSYPNVLLISSKTDQAAAVLKAQIKDYRQHCGATTAIVLVGYSQGAWVVDRTVRLLGRSKDINERQALRSVVGVFLMGDPAWPLTKVGLLTRAGVATWFRLGYRDRDKDYLNNELSYDEFQSICLGLSSGRIDPVCMGLKSNVRRWNRDIGVHGMYVETGVTRRGGDFLYPLAQRHST